MSEMSEIMKVFCGSLFRCLGFSLAVMVTCASAPFALAKPLNPELVQGIGNWVGVDLSNGTAFAGRIVSVDEQSFGLQLHNDPAITPIRYGDVVKLHTGISNGVFWAVAAGGIAGTVAIALIAHSAFENAKNHELLLPPAGASLR